MSVAVIGGLDRLKHLYTQKGKKRGLRIKIFSQRVPDMGKRLNGFNGIVLFTDTVSHSLVREVVIASRKYGIPIERSHSSSLAGLQRSLNGLALA